MNIFKYDFLQAKLRAIHSKSVIGVNYDKLKKISAIDKLFKELFHEYSYKEEGIFIFNELEKKYKIKILGQINYIAKYFDCKNKFINSLIIRYEIDNLKILLNAYFSKQKKADNLFELKFFNSLNYELINKSDISVLENIQIILKDTAFKFIIDLLNENKEHFEIENAIDKFYYQSMLDSLTLLNKHEYDSIKNIIIEEMNWQNITWAFRTKIYYKKSFKNVKDTFLSHKWLIDSDKLEAIYDLNFLPNQAGQQIKNFPPFYIKFILGFFNSDGLFDLVSFEESVVNRLISKYILFFHIENFNLLPVISFIYLKQVEYNNVIKLIESLRYNIKPE